MLTRCLCARRRHCRYSSDLDEILTISSRVLFGGTLREMPLDRETIDRAMLGLP